MNATLDRSLTEQLNHRLSEAWQTLWDSFVDPREAFSDDGHEWTSLGSLAGDARTTLPFTTEQELAAIRGQCRTLAVENEFAINGHENRISFLVGDGHTYRAAVKKGSRQAGATDDPGLAAEAQAVLDEFIAENRWQRRQQEIVRRYDRDGEVFLRFFVDTGGITRVRFVEPTQIATPRELAGDPSHSFGIQTEPDDVETPLAYYIDGEPVDAALIQHRKANVDANVKRGLPLFYPVRKNLRRAEKILRNMSVVAEIQSAIALVRRHQNATRSGVQQFAAAQTDVRVTSPASGQTASFRRFAPGTILDSHGGIEYDFPAQSIDAANFVAILQAELRAIASRLVMPEFMLTSDASNANYASTMVAEGPAVRMFSRLQAELVEDDLAVMRRVLAAAVSAGRLPLQTLTSIEIQAAPPSLAVRDQLKEAQTLRIQHQSGILSLQTWSQLTGLDYDQEQTNLQTARAASLADAVAQQTSLAGAAAASPNSDANAALQNNTPLQDSETATRSFNMAGKAN